MNPLIDGLPKRKFKVTKKWPGGPEVGSMLEEHSYGLIVATKTTFFEKELEEYIQEVKPDEFWFINKQGLVEIGSEYGYCRYNLCPPPHWFRFRTKESAERFVKALKGSHKGDLRCMDVCQYEITAALNNRIND